jgi:hypothetical protein
MISFSLVISLKNVHCTGLSIRVADPDPDPERIHWYAFKLLDRNWIQVLKLPSNLKNYNEKTSVVDRHLFDADPDPYPTFHF